MRIALFVSWWAALSCLEAVAHAQPAPNPVLETIDRLHMQRDQPEARAELRRVVDGAVLQHPKRAEVLWRGARLYFWESDEPSLSKEARAQLARTGWELGDRAAALAPGRVEGHFWAAANMGNYGLAVGPWRALREGLEGKFTERLRRAEKLNPDYQAGSIQVAWGRFHDKMPWPKRDVGKAESYYRHVLKKFPENVRARLFYAELLLDRDRRDEARRLLGELALVKEGAYDAPEERRMKALAKSLDARLR